MIASPRGFCRAGLSAPSSAGAAPLIGGGKLPFLALGLFSLAVLTPAPDRLGAASHLEMSVTTYSTTSTLQPGLEPHSTARRSNGAQTETPKPAGLAVLGLRTPRRFHGYAITVNAERKRAREMESTARADPRQAKISVAVPTDRDNQWLHAQRVAANATNCGDDVNPVVGGTHGMLCAGAMRCGCHVNPIRQRAAHRSRRSSG
jgi:hypothetical protein